MRVTSSTAGPRRAGGGSPTVEVVDDTRRLEGALAAIESPTVGVDVERADGHRYYRRAALVQVGDAGHSVLADPLAIDDFGSLSAFLGERFPILHAVENDLEPLEALGVSVERLADTAVAAAVLGLPTGLANLLTEVLDVSLAADKDRFQRADWEERPLPDDMIAYAAGDVVHLPALWDRLSQRLAEAGRTAWYEQELAATVAGVDEDRRDWRRLRGTGRLSPSQRAVLRELWEEREAIARQYDVAPGRLLKDHTLIDLAGNPADSQQDLLRRNRRRTAALKTHAERLFAAQQRGLRAEPEAGDSGVRWHDDDRRAYDAMRRSRAALAKELGLDPGVLCPSRSLRHAVAHSPSDCAELCDLAGMRPWQRSLLGDRLWDVYVRSRESSEER